MFLSDQILLTNILFVCETIYLDITNISKDKNISKTVKGNFQFTQSP